MTGDSEKDLTGCFFIVLLTVIMVIGLFLGGLFGEKVGREATQKQAIKQGVAQYNPDTGQFEWKKRIID
jgi:hypothetical protein